MARDRFRTHWDSLKDKINRFSNIIESLLIVKKPTIAPLPLVFILPEKTKSEQLHIILKHAGEFTYPGMDVRAEHSTKVNKDGSKDVVAMSFEIIFWEPVPAGIPSKKRLFSTLVKYFKLTIYQPPSIHTFRLLLNGEGLTPGNMNSALTFSFYIWTRSPEFWAQINDVENSPYAHILSSYRTFISEVRKIVMENLSETSRRT